MKKANLFMYALFTLFIVSCSKDNDNSNSTVDDLIIGVWKPVKDVDSSTGTSEIYTYTTCEQKSKITIEANGNLKVLSFYDDSGNCIQDVSFVSGSWEKISEGNYKVTTIFFDDDTQQNETDIESISISFPNSNTMKIEFDSTYFTEYSRVQ